ncbi:mucin-binding protein [Lactobacillus hominis]|uniref:Mucus binding protein n=1 Tax=Lactobacillus hominis DSM 23910 = CRBIP 24.179 TaxID=1423758 RepID=I7IVV8_9LACO|nr:LPXTG cell wall anchor domain-containing protein [Lactobacillus hominis]KRM84156.1 hypothetical protein FC41_GL001477 [Lactobacillus hominis DSM 23910 = CRBIP 24.179]MCT3348369.1 LPXTG cell wall anchor domain-containing protein [Lactobacillus hominis]CCI82118.1 Mucus binding protein [Lactobacillus hominis DSM 23910 = CRBIP 24.179]
MKAGHIMFKNLHVTNPTYKKMISVALSLVACGLLFAIPNVAQASATSELANETIPVKENYENVVQSRTVTQTIYYQYEDGREAAPTYKASVVFKRIDIQNDQNRAIVNLGGQWVPNKQTTQEVTSPQIDGFIPDQKSVNSKLIDPCTQDQVTVVTYHRTLAQNEAANSINNSRKQNNTNKAINKQVLLPVVVHEQAKMPSHQKTASPVKKENSESIKVLPETGENKMTMITYLGFMLVLVATFFETYLVSEKN